MDLKGMSRMVTRRVLKNGIKYETESELVQSSSINIKEILENEIRLDAGFYDLTYRRARDLVEKCKSGTAPLFGLNGFAKSISYPPRFKRAFVDGGVPIYTASQILDLIPKTDKYISSKTDTNLKDLILKKNQIIMTRSGTIGNLCIVSETLEGKTFSDDIIRIELNNDGEAGFIYSFLKTFVGQQILKHNKYGSVIKHIEPEHLEEILIPNANKSLKMEIGEKIRKALQKRDDAVSLFEKSRLLVNKTLGADSVEKIKKEVESTHSNAIIFAKKSSELKDRFDAFYHNPIYNQIESELQNSDFPLTTLGDARVSKQIILPGRFKRTYVDKDHGIPFLSGGDIMQFVSIDPKFLSHNIHKKRIEKELKLKESSILVTCSGTIGNVVLTPKHFEGWTANQHIIRIIPSESINPGYLYAYLSGIFGNNLIKHWAYGAVVQEIDNKQVSMVKIPIVPKDVEKEIGDTALEGARRWTEAYLLEHEVISKMENLIRSGDL